MKGSLIPDKIVFYISKEPYLLDEGIKSLPKLKNDRVEFKYVENFGPFRRVQPIVQEYWDKPDTIIILIDDDKKIPKNAIKELVNYSNKNPNEAIGYRGYIMNYEPNEMITDYLNRKLYFAWRIKKPVKVDVINGGWCQLVKPKFFHEDFLNWKNFLEFGVDRSDETFIAYLMAKNKTVRKVIPLKKEIKDYSFYDLTLFNSNLNREAKLKQLNTWLKVLRNYK
ncbi:MAG: hypothetical protein ACFFAN_09740 [Promethearchaeota archaeon]